MGQLIASGAVTANDLEGAYQKAIWSDPDIRAALMKEQFDKQMADAKKEQEAKAKAARAAAISPAGRAPSGPVVTGGKPSGKQSVRDSINASIRELQDQRA